MFTNVNTFKKNHPQKFCVALKNSVICQCMRNWFILLIQGTQIYNSFSILESDFTDMTFLMQTDTLPDAFCLLSLVPEFS
jgi:hypothetical protein